VLGVPCPILSFVIEVEGRGLVGGLAGSELMLAIEVFQGLSRLRGH
jgi:hypothetical protein